MGKHKKKSRRVTDIYRKKSPRPWAISLSRAVTFLLVLGAYSAVLFIPVSHSPVTVNLENALRFFGVSGIVFILLYLFLIISSFRPSPRLKSGTQYIIFATMNLIILIAAVVVRQHQQSLFIIPLGLFACVYAIIYGTWIAAVSSFILSLFIGFIIGWNQPEIFIGLCSGAIVSSYYASTPRRRSQLLKAGILISLIHITVILCFSVLHGTITSGDMNRTILTAGLNGIAVGVLLANGLFIVEKFFGITTGISLLELSDQNQPCLKELVLQCPGSYHHSLLVGNLAETAAESIGADALLARVASYYHDIGKILKPEYFTENMTSTDSRHDRLTEAMSALVIISHVKDGVSIAREYGVPHPILDIIKQHHGTSRVEYFYTQAVEKYGNREVDQSLFRYPGPKPRTKEAGIVMVADSVEAASRSLSEPSGARIRSLVTSIINNKLADQQFDECSLSMREISRIRESLIKALNSMFHTRVSYSGNDKS